MRVERVLETCLYAEDLAGAEVFYREVLGLEMVASEPDRHRFFRCGCTMLLVFNPEATLDESEEHEVPRHGCRGRGHVAFAVSGEDLPGWRERLVRQGVAIEREVSGEGGLRSLYFRDPAGNSVELATPRLWGLTE